LPILALKVLSWADHVIEGHEHLLFWPAAVLLCLGREHLAISRGKRGLKQRAGPKLAAQHDVELGGVDDKPRDEREPEHESENEGEDPVHC
jgi:hypothetical protein